MPIRPVLVVIASLLRQVTCGMPVLISIALGYGILEGIRFPPGTSDQQAYLLLLALAYGPMSLYAFIAVGTDKLIAVLNRKQHSGIPRIPEQYLHMFEWLCGWPGSFVAQRIFRHKTAKLLYQLQYAAIVIFHISFVTGRYAYEHEEPRVVVVCGLAAAIAFALQFFVNAQRYAIALEKADDERDRLERQNEREEF